MHSNLLASLALIATLVVATPVAKPAASATDEVSGIVDGVLTVTTFDSNWHEPTANDLAVITANGTYSSDEAGFPISENSAVEKRQSGQYFTNTFRVGNGNPHQNPYHQQQSPTINCTTVNCAASAGYSHSVTWTASANANFGWISGGFTVSETNTHSDSVSCSSTIGQDVCVFFVYGVTAYTVSSTQCYYYNGYPSRCRNLGNRVLFSPNNCQPANAYCASGSGCHYDNYGYYDKTNAPAGGPPC